MLRSVPQGLEEVTGEPIMVGTSWVSQVAEEELFVAVDRYAIALARLASLIELAKTLLWVTEVRRVGGKGNSMGLILEARGFTLFWVWKGSLSHAGFHAC